MLRMVGEGNKWTEIFMLVFLLDTVAKPTALNLGNVLRFVDAHRLTQYSV